MLPIAAGTIDLCGRFLLCFMSLILAGSYNSPGGPVTTDRISIRWLNQKKRYWSRDSCWYWVSRRILNRIHKKTHLYHEQKLMGEKKVSYSNLNSEKTHIFLSLSQWQYRPSNLHKEAGKVFSPISRWCLKTKHQEWLSSEIIPIWRQPGSWHEPILSTWRIPNA